MSIRNHNHRDIGAGPHRSHRGDGALAHDVLVEHARGAAAAVDGVAAPSSP